jgi:hypothetical protein
MTSWLRTLGLRAALLCALLVTVLATHAAVARPNLPFALLDSFERAFALVYDAAERKIAQLESADPAPARHDLPALLRVLGAHVAAACDAAATALDVELVTANAWSMERRAAVLGCLERHLRDARRALASATDPDERAEYQATCDRLRDVRQLI